MGVSSLKDGSSGDASRHRCDYVHTEFFSCHRGPGLSALCQSLRPGNCTVGIASNFSSTSAQGAKRLVEVLQNTLPHLSEETLGQRLDWAIRIASMSIAQQAAQRNAFKGEDAKLAYYRTIDAMVGILGAEVSKEAHALEGDGSLL